LRNPSPLLNQFNLLNRQPLHSQRQLKFMLHLNPNLSPQHGTYLPSHSYGAYPHNISNTRNTRNVDP
jgi:hypothetical protein